MKIYDEGGPLEDAVINKVLAELDARQGTSNVVSMSDHLAGLTREERRNQRAYALSAAERLVKDYSLPYSAIYLVASDILDFVHGGVIPTVDLKTRLDALAKQEAGR